MKRILTIAIVICLAVTMTCSGVVADAIEPNSVEIINLMSNESSLEDTDSVNTSLCPYCLTVSLVSTTTRTETLNVGNYQCTHGYTSGYDTYVRERTYKVYHCNNCGNVEELISDNLIIYCYGY